MYLKSCEDAGYKIDSINLMIINITKCLCNIRIKHYIDKPMSMLERRINYIITKNPQLIIRIIVILQLESTLIYDLTICK